MLTATSEPYSPRVATLGVRDALGAGRREYRTATPFPHAVLESFFDDDLLDAVAAEFAPPQEMSVAFDDATSVKAAEPRWEAFGPSTRRLLAEMHSEPFLDGLTRLTGIKGLVPDPYLFGGGQHQIARGGNLRVHADFNRHPGLGLDRRLNVLLYLTRDWDDDWGGHLELWDERMERAVVRVAPSFNTMVAFSTTSTSFHGHPSPLACPPGVTRRSIALYYYTVSPGDRPPAHSTLWQARPGEAPPPRRRLTAATRHFRAGAKELAPDWLIERLRRGDKRR